MAYWSRRVDADAIRGGGIVTVVGGAARGRRAATSAPQAASSYYLHLTRDRVRGFKSKTAGSWQAGAGTTTTPSCI